MRLAYLDMCFNVSFGRRVGKKGQMFAMYLVLVTLLMCFVVVLMYVGQRDEVDSSVITPKVFMELESDKILFEMWEKSLLISACDDVGLQNWDKGDFASKTRASFLKLVESSEQEKFREFIFRHMVFNGVPASFDEVQKKDFIEKVLYAGSNFYFNGAVLVFRRDLTTKSFKLEPGKRTKNMDIILTKANCITILPVSNSLI